MAKKQITREIKAIGNGMMIPIRKSDIEALGLSIGSTVRVEISPIGTTYDETRLSARKMRARFPRTLQLLGK